MFGKYIFYVETSGKITKITTKVMQFLDFLFVLYTLSSCKDNIKKIQTKNMSIYFLLLLCGIGATLEEIFVK